MKIYERDIMLKFTRVFIVSATAEISEPTNHGLCTLANPKGEQFGFVFNYSDLGSTMQSSKIITTGYPNLRYRINGGVEKELETEDDILKFRLKMLNTQMEELLS